MADITLCINGYKYEVPPACPADLSLCDFLRDWVGLRGTKAVCRQGGCGTCTVTVERHGSGTGQAKPKAINSCLVPVWSTGGWRVTTIEGLGSKKDGLHPIQRHMADCGATQCGYCTPGVGMNIYGLLQAKPQPSDHELERCLDGSLCRCTDYRTIVDAARSCTANGGTPTDIEDLAGTCSKPKDSSMNLLYPNSSVAEDNRVWFHPTSAANVYGILDSHKGKSVRLTLGHTAPGIYKEPFHDAYVDLQHVQELNESRVEGGSLHVGSNLCVSDLQDAMLEAGKTSPGFQRLADKLVPYLNGIANTAIRNMSSWAGNLVVQHKHPDFVSDIATVFTALGITLTIGNSTDKQDVNMEEFFLMDLTDKVILTAHIPELGEHEVFDVSRVGGRAVNSAAVVSTAFKLTLVDGKVEGRPTLAFGGVSNHVKRPAEAEKTLDGKRVHETHMLADALKELDKELDIRDTHLVSAIYRRTLARNLLFKFLLGVADPNGKSPQIQRGVTRTSHVEHETLTDRHPVSEPIPKLDSDIQTTGEAVFVTDMPRCERELACALVRSTIGRGRISRVDCGEARKTAGVIDILTAANIPTNDVPLCKEVFAADNVSFHGQPIALVIAEDRAIANRAASLVQVTYSSAETPIVRIRDAISQKYFHDVESEPNCVGNCDGAMQDAKKIVDGELHIGRQYHFYLEPQTALCVPTEGGYDIWSSSQWPGGIQSSVADMLGLATHSVQVHVPRVGGAFGGKQQNSIAAATYAALVAHQTNRFMCFFDKPQRIYI